MPDAEMRDEGVPVERRDVAIRGLLLFAAGFVLFCVVALASLRIFFGSDFAWPDLGRAGQGAPNAPALQAAPAKVLAAYREEQRAALDRLEWVDRRQGVARIPIDRAMEIIARDGLPPGFGDAETARDPACDVLLATPRAPQAARCRRPE